MNGSSSSRTGVLIVGHGSREPGSNEEFERFVSDYSSRRPDLEVRGAYIELAAPDFKSALNEFAKSCSRIVVVPLFLFSAGHTKNDIPLVLDEVSRQFPNTEFLPSSAIGVHPKMLELLHLRTREALKRTESRPEKTAVLVVGRGSSDADANSDFYKVVRLFEESNYYHFVMPTFIGITKPQLQDSLEIAAKLRPERILVLPYFLFGGKLITVASERLSSFSTNYPWIRTMIAGHFGSDRIVHEILDERIREAILGTGRLPCATCEYREKLPGLTDKVGGLKALLWSVRHMETHSQAAPHAYPHPNLKKHVLVCDNIDCAHKGSGSLIARLRSEIKNSGKQKDFRVTRVSCLGRCGEGPSLVIYPDGIWYQGVQEPDAPEIVQDHLLNDKIVSRLVDSIMQ
ncbi:ferredoxin [Leptospira fletcheri]|uniref:Ferredoxin n=1 Tax=Leptospira fletcheri TaxID=2484981 RepID=A0A4R9GIY1_9LEPT|nr:CbiX/SirB N-terminal domain-containing protein [Leptospira fletcheri]TGK12589.1 ferredoxin [Leptospira fletcheri]